MAKSTAIQGKGHAFFLNGDIVKRLQSGDWGADLAVEKVMEMANAGYVEKIPDLPKVSVSLDTNDVGNLAMLYLLKTGQRLAPVDTLTLSRDANGAYSVTTSGEVTITMDGTTNDLDETRTTASGQMCPSMLIKVSEHNNATIDRTCHLQGLYLDTVEFSYDVGGMAKENYRISGDHKDWYFNGTDFPSADIDIVFAEYASGVTATTTHAKPTDTTVEAIYVNKELIYHRRTSIGATLNPVWAASTLTVDTASTFPDDSRIEIIYSYDTGHVRSFPALTTSNTGHATYGTRGGLRRGNVVIYMEKQTGSTITDAQAKQLRLQSVSGSLDMGRQERTELGTQRYTDKQPTYPLNVRFDMTFNASDLQAFAYASGQEDKWLDGSLSYLSVANIVNNTKITIELYDSASVHTASHLVKTIVMNNCTVSNEGDTARVGSEAGQWRCTMETDNIVWTGKIWQ
jgi:hypothetical protein